MSEPSEPIDLGELRERLRATQEAAEKLAGHVPPQGWASATSREREETVSDIQALAAVLHALRELVPPELWDEVREVLRRLLLLLRALLDVAVERLDAEGERAPRGGGPDLQDIPIA
jgi:hypothetical protein